MANDPPHRLAKILDYKREEIRTLQSDRSLRELESEAREIGRLRGFEEAITTLAADDGNALICEIKRRSPSAGDINATRSPRDAARSYQAGGASCISVLTDGPSFGGSMSDLVETRDAVSLPILRKDFMLEPIQVLESRAAGADAILVIMAAVSDAQALELSALASDLGMAVLVESHSAQELERALQLPSPLMGINNRDLRTFTTDLGVTEALAAAISDDRVLISESGIHNTEAIVRLRACGARGFLVGEAPMRAENPEAFVRGLVEARN